MIAYQIYGHHAIRIAERDGVVLRAYTQPELGNQIFLSLDQARQAVADNVRTVFCEVVPIGWSNGMPSGRNVDDYFRHGQYLGADEDGIEPRWAEASKASPPATDWLDWTVDTSGPAKNAIVDSTGRVIAFGNLSTEDLQQDIANLTVMAAAPRLVKALEDAIHAADELTDGQIDPSHGQEERDFQAALAAARTLIAEVKGTK